MSATAQKAASVPLLSIQFDPPATDDGKKVEIMNAGKKRARFECGHRGPSYFEINVFGTVLKPQDGKASLKACDACTLEHFRDSIRCCACGTAIIVGGGVTIERYEEPPIRTWKSPYVLIHGTIYGVGCRKIDCVPPGASPGGRLVKGGIDQSFEDAIQLG